MSIRSTTTKPTTTTKPIRHNGAEAYLRRYLNSVSDWRNFLSTGSLEKQATMVTGAYFGADALKGAAFLLGTHLSQQASASAVSLTLRLWMTRSERLAEHRGIAVYQLLRPQRLRVSAQTKSLKQEWRLFRSLSGIDRAAARIEQKVHIYDHYFFTEGGRSWLCYTLRFPAKVKDEADRALSVLTMLGFPNRGYYFDRALAFSSAIDLTRGHITAESIPGFIGDVNELDILLPLIRLFKLGLYGLNWYLVRPEERDGPAPDVTAYNNLTPPPGGSQGGGASRGGRGVYSTKRRRSGIHSPPPTPSTAYYGYGSYGNGYNGSPPPPPPPPPPPDYYGAPAAPVQSSFLPQNNAAANLSKAPVEIIMAVETAGERKEEWITIEEDAYVVLDGYNRLTGLAVAPAISVNDQGEFVPLAGQWHIIHTSTGRIINPTPLKDAYQARQLAARLLAAVSDWTRHPDTMNPQERQRAQDALNGAAAPPPPPNGNAGIPF